MMIKGAGFAVSQIWFQILNPPLSGCVIFDKPLNLSEPQLALSVKKKR